MLRTSLGFIAISAATAASAEPHTTRIETRTVNGAIVTYEEGVRVFRPLPADRHVIVNPRGATPLVIGVDGGGASIVTDGRSPAAGK